LTALRQWLLAQQTQVLPKSPIAAAINYGLNQWEALLRYTTDGDLHIDNNLSERTLKLIGIGRNNWLFFGSDQGGQTAAVLFSFTATQKHGAGPAPDLGNRPAAGGPRYRRGGRLRDDRRPACGSSRPRVRGGWP
jgi:hypothetical protein